MLSPNTDFPKSFMTESLQRATVLAHHYGDYYGCVDDPEAPLAVRWNANGHDIRAARQAEPTSPETLICPYPTDATGWEALSPDERHIARCIIDRHAGRKIHGIKMLKHLLGWGLTESKNLYEDIARNA